MKKNPREDGQGGDNASQYKTAHYGPVGGAVRTYLSMQKKPHYASEALVSGLAASDLDPFDQP